MLRPVAGVMVTVADVQHGSLSTYVNWMCRCSPCADAGHEYQAAYRESSKAVSS